MKSDHLFAVIIFNNVYIMLGAEIISPSLKPAGLICYLEILLLASSVFLRLFEETWPEHFWTNTAPHYYNGFSELSEAVLQDWPDASQHLQTYVHRQKVEI